MGSCGDPGLSHPPGGVPFGRAFILHEAGGQERWIVPDTSAQQWLLWLGSLDIGGFRESVPDTGPSSVTRSLGPRLSDSLPTEPMPWLEACEMVITLARGLQACEERKIRAGPIEPETLRWQGEPGASTLVLADSGAVLRLVEATPRWPTTRGLWRPPETPAGKPSSSADRYALGRLLYRLLAAEEPFPRNGVHVRDAEPSALPKAVADALSPGLHSVVLWMIHSSPRQRPGELQDIISRLEACVAAAATPDEPIRAIAPASTVFGGVEQLLAMNSAEDRSVNMPAVSAPNTGPGTGQGSAVPHARSAPSQSGPALTPSSRTLRPIAPPARKGRVASLIGGGIAAVLAAGAAWVLGGMADEAGKPTPSLRATTPMVASSMSPDDCGSCHARQTMEWRRSIMGQSARSPLFQSLEMLIEEQVGRSDRCPNGAGVLRFVNVESACTVEAGGRAITGAGGEGWCINCHSPLTNVTQQVPAWDAMREQSDRRRPLKSMLSEAQLEGIDCAFCHQVTRGVEAGDEDAGTYVGNRRWRSFLADQSFEMRPEAATDPGISNSAYHLDAEALAVGVAGDAGMPHATTPAAVKEYRKSSEFCGSCHDVRLFGSDSIGVERGEHFKRLRNAYSEWKVWADDRARASEPVYSCQDCHMSTFPGVCVPDGEAGNTVAEGDSALRRACPSGTHFEASTPGSYPQGAIANRSEPSSIVSHYFSSVDLPLAPEFSEDLVEERGIDASGTPLGLRGRRDLLLGVAFRFELEPASRTSSGIEVPLVMENIGAGHRVPAGFSQEREIWVHLRVTDAAGELVYEVGRVDADDEDLHDKIFEKVTVRDDQKDEQGRPLGVFGADVVDGPDVPQWDPDPALGGTEFRGLGLINLQNGFLRCVTCRGTVEADGTCTPGFLQNGHRADRFDDGDYDIDTGECRSNLEGHHRFLEVYFPVGALDSKRGVVRGPDSIIDTRSLPPDTPVRYTYTLPAAKAKGPLKVEARLLFRGFPPFLLKAFAEYEEYMVSQGARPDGPLLTKDTLKRLEVVELHRRTLVIE